VGDRESPVTGREPVEEMEVRRPKVDNGRRWATVRQQRRPKFEIGGAANGVWASTCGGDHRGGRSRVWASSVGENEDKGRLAAGGRK